MTCSEIERELRLEWWCGHGCNLAVLYGDDGEMQCNNISRHGAMDFKRIPLDELRERVIKLRVLLAAEASSK